MAFLVCSFASDRTEPEKLERYIVYLEAMLRKSEGDPVQAQAIEMLLRRAQQWMGGRKPSQ